MIFNNHSPINMEKAKEVAKVDYSPDFGHNFYRLTKGKMFHLYHSSSSGMDYGRGTTVYREYLFGARSLEEVTEWLREKAQMSAIQAFRADEEDYSFAAKMLEELGDYGEEA